MDIMFPPIFNNYSSVAEFLEKYYDEQEIKVYNVRSGSPSEAAGLQEDDVIVEFDGKEFPTVTDLRMYVFSLPIGKEVKVVVERPIQTTRNSVRRNEIVELYMTVGVKRTYDAEFSV